MGSPGAPGTEPKNSLKSEILLPATQEHWFGFSLNNCQDEKDFLTL